MPIRNNWSGKKWRKNIAFCTAPRETTQNGANIRIRQGGRVGGKQFIRNNQSINSASPIFCWCWWRLPIIPGRVFYRSHYCRIYPSGAPNQSTPLAPQFSKWMESKLTAISRFYAIKNAHRILAWWLSMFHMSRGWKAFFPRTLVWAIGLDVFFSEGKQWWTFFEGLF